MPIWYGQTTGGRKSKNQQTIVEPEPEEEVVEPPKPKPKPEIKDTERKLGSCPRGFKRTAIIDCKEFESLEGASVYLGRHKGYLKDLIRDKGLSLYKIDNHDVEIIHVKRKPRIKPARRTVVEVDGQVYDTMKDAEQALGIHRGYIRRLQQRLGRNEFPVGEHKVKLYN
jgi:hypothetical protein